MDSLLKLGINLQGVFLYVINFGVLLALMYRFVYKPLLKAVDERRSQIAENLQQAERMREEFTQAQAGAEQQRAAALVQAREEASKLIAAAEANAATLLAQAESRAATMVRDAEERTATLETGLLERVQAEALSRVERAVEVILREHVPADTVAKSVKDVWNAKV